ncbi:MAG: T9SS type A sorting domain-containing protein, partial [Bacteroidetes bacterium]|nr:T9SS type A sorting domain-containing protein [Bacteroidota bacterium]
YPNPTNSSTKIDYTLPNGINKGEIVFYDTQGKEVKRFNVDNTFNSLEISTEDLRSGIYYYNLQTAQGNSGAKKLVTVK